MKTFAFVLAVLGLAVASAQAEPSADRSTHEVPDGIPVSVRAQYTVEVPAEKIISSGDLVNGTLSASDLMTVTRFRSTGVVDIGK